MLPSPNTMWIPLLGLGEVKM